MSKSFVAEPQCNGIIERFHRILEEDVFAVNSFKSLEEARIKIQTFINDYNKNWRLHKLNLFSPLEYRRKRSADSSSKIASNGEQSQTSLNYAEERSNLSKENEERNLMGNTELKGLFVLNLCGSMPLKIDIRTLNAKNGVLLNCNTPSYYPMV